MGHPITVIAHLTAEISLPSSYPEAKPWPPFSRHAVRQGGAAIVAASGDDSRYTPCEERIPNTSTLYSVLAYEGWI